MASKTASASGHLSTGKLLALSWPILVPMISQNLRLVVDIAMLGRLGHEGLAAQGVTIYLAMLLLAPLYALDSPVQAAVSRAEGATDNEAANRAIKAALVLGVFGGTLYGLALWGLAGPLTKLVIHDHSVQQAGYHYLQPILITAPFAGIVSTFYGYWLAKGRTIINLLVDAAMQVTNLFAAYILIFGKFGLPSLGIQGAGIAMAISTSVGAILYILVSRDVAFPKISNSLWLIRSESEVISMTWHNVRFAIQSYALFVLLYFIVQSTGTLQLASFSVLMNLASFLVYPAQAFATAAATLAGKAIGEGKPHIATAWAVRALQLCVVVTGILGAPFWLFPNEVLFALTGSQEIARLAQAETRVLGITIVFTALGFGISGLLMGTGGANRARRINFVTQGVLLVPIALIAGPLLGFGLMGIWLGLGASRVLAAVLLWREWRDWQRTGFALAHG